MGDNEDKYDKDFTRDDLSRNTMYGGDNEITGAEETIPADYAQEADEKYGIQPDTPVDIQFADEVDPHKTSADDRKQYGKKRDKPPKTKPDGKLLRTTGEIVVKSAKWSFRITAWSVATGLIELFSNKDAIFCLLSYTLVYYSRSFFDAGDRNFGLFLLGLAIAFYIGYKRSGEKGWIMQMIETPVKDMRTSVKRKYVDIKKTFPGEE